MAVPYIPSQPFHKEAACNPKVVKDLKRALELVKDEKCAKSPYDYFNHLWGIFRREIQDNKSRASQLEHSDPDLDNRRPLSFLKSAECRLIAELFQHICDKLIAKSVLEHPTTIHIQDIQENDVLSIQIPSLIAGYHFITAIIDKNKENVIIFQSFGYNKTLYKKELTFEKFKTLLQDSLDISNEESYEEGETNKKIYNVEKMLFGINVQDTVEKAIRPPLKSKNSNKKSSKDDSDCEDTMTPDTEDEYVENLWKLNYKEGKHLTIHEYKFVSSDCPASSNKGTSKGKGKGTSKGTRRTRKTHRRRKTHKRRTNKK